MNYHSDRSGGGIVRLAFSIKHRVSPSPQIFASDLCRQKKTRPMWKHRPIFSSTVQGK